jgi:hypothetical protein
MVICSKPVILLVISFLVVGLIYSSYSRSDVFAKPKVTRGQVECSGKGDPSNPAKRIKCCQTETDNKGIEIRWCTVCDNTDPPSNCGPRYQERRAPTTGEANLPTGGGVIEQPATPKKHGGTVLPKGGGALENPSTDQVTNSKKGNDNSPTPPACPDKGPIPPNCTLKPKF